MTAASPTPVDHDGRRAKKSPSDAPMASVREVLGFVWQLGTGTRALFVLGTLSGIGNGMVYPALAYLFSSSFSSIAGASNNGLDQVRQIAYTFMVLGAFALVMACIQTGCFEICAHRATKSFRLQWFQALLRQDAAFFDVYDIGGTLNADSFSLPVGPLNDALYLICWLTNTTRGFIQPSL